MKDTSMQLNNLYNAKYYVHMFNQGFLDREQISFLLETWRLGSTAWGKNLKLDVKGRFVLQI